MDISSGGSNGLDDGVSKGVTTVCDTGWIGTAGDGCVAEGLDRAGGK